MGLSLQHLLRYADEGEDMLNRIVIRDESWLNHYPSDSKRKLGSLFNNDCHTQFHDFTLRGATVFLISEVCVVTDCSKLFFFIKSLGTAATSDLSYKPQMIDEDDFWSIWWNKDWQGKPKYSEKTCPSATLSTTKSENKNIVTF
jgi:hypothetical protein